MRITGLSIERYKTVIAPLELKSFGHLHILIGPNESGKTTLLDALNLGRSISGKTVPTREPFSFSLSFEHEGKAWTSRVGTGLQADIHTLSMYSRHVIRLSATDPIPLSQLRTDVESFVATSPQLFQKFTSTFSRYFAPALDIKGQGIDRGPIELMSEALSRLSEYGSGFQQVYIILLYLFHPTYQILLLDEPEIHLHPTLIKKLLRALEDNSLNNQVFMTTHSPLFIHPKNIHQIFRVSRGLSGTRVFTMRSSPIRIERMRLEQELDSDNCEMFLADEVLLVEGVSDRLLMRGLIDRFYNGEKGIKVIFVEGKSNMEVYVDLLEVFSIPYAVMLDNDALNTPLSPLLLRYVKQGDVRNQELVRRDLKRHHIYILPNGGIERQYPRQYQVRRRKKPLNALFAASRVTEGQYRSDEMSAVREVIEAL